MEKHITILGILFILFHVTTLAVGIILLLTFMGVGLITTFSIQHFTPLPVGLLTGIGWLIGGGFIIISLPGVITGAGLIRFKPWGRILALVLAVFQIVNFLFGTALAVYAFIVLLSHESSLLFKRAD